MDKLNLTYNNDFVEINGPNYSRTIPVSAISAVFIETKKSPIWFLVVAGILVIIAIATVKESGVAALVCILVAAAFVASWVLGNKAVYGVRSDGHEYGLSLKGSASVLSSWNADKEKLSKIVLEGRKQCHPAKE